MNNLAQFPKKVLVQAYDSLVNLVNGMGTSADQSQARSYQDRILTDYELEVMYRNNWICRKVVDLPAFDMVRERRAWKAEPEQITAIENVENKLQYWQKIRRALTWARLYGGAAIIIDNGALHSTELKPDTFPKEGIKALHVVSKRRCLAGDLIDDIRSPWFGQPEYFELSGSNTINLRIHPSRVVMFHGNPAPDTDLVEDIWGDSILKAVYDALMNAAAATQGLSAMIDDAKTDVVAVKELATKVSTTTDRNRMIARWNLFRQQKYLNNVALMDMDEERFDRHATSFTGLSDVVMAQMLIASGAADIPATRMLGQAPTGLNSTGEFDLLNYYNSIEAKQNNELRPALEYLDQFMVRHAIGKYDEELWFDFSPLWTPTEKEQAEIHKLNSEVVASYVGNPAVNQAALQKGIEGLLVDSGVFPGFEQALKEFEQFDPDPEDLIAGLGEELEDEKDPESEDEPEDAEGGDDADDDTKPNKTPRAKDTFALPRNKHSIATRDAAPRTLYVRRRVLNSDQLIEWARQTNFPTPLIDELHVTICYSRTRVDWMRVPTLEFPDSIQIANGSMPRLIERFGDSVVLLFRSRDLEYRHKRLLEAGASFDFDYYQPHVTLSSSIPHEFDLSKITPYYGPLMLGPELWEEVKESPINLF